MNVSSSRTAYIRSQKYVRLGDKIVKYLRSTFKNKHSYAFVTPMGQGALPMAISMYASFAMM